MPASHVTAGSTSVSLPIPLFSTGHTVVGGWFRCPASVSGGLQILNSGNWGTFINASNVYCDVDSVQRWSLVPNTQDGDLSAALFLSESTWVFIAIDRCSTSTTFWFLRDGHKAIFRRVATATQTDNETAILFGGADGFTGDLQYWWCYQGATPPTEAQLFAMAQTDAPNSVFTLSRFWPLTDGSGTATIGGVNATSTATTSSYTAPATAITADVAYSTVISRYNTYPLGDAYCSTTPIAIGSSGTHNITTVCGWVKLDQANDTNAYLFAFVDAANVANVLIFVCQHTMGRTDLQINIMSPLNGDQSVYSPSTGTEALALGWLFCAWVVDQNGTNATISTYLGIGEGSTLALLGTAALPTNETFPSTWLPTVGIGDNNYSLRHLRVYTGSTAPSLSTLQTRMNAASADVTAWSDWGFGDGDLYDRSGNARSLHARADLFRGLASPSLIIGNEAAVTASITAPTALVAATAQQPDPVAVVAASVEAPTGAASATVYGVTFVGVGAVASGTAAITPALPSGLSVGDTLFLALETANQAISIATANGGTWTEVTGSPQGTGTAAGTSATRLTVFTSTYNGSQTAPVTSDSGDHQVGVILAYRGCDPTTPINITSSGVEATSDTSWSITGATSTVANCRVVVIGTRMNDAAGAAFSAWTNANLSGITERLDDGTTQGNGGGIGIADGLKATSGAYNATTVTNATTTVKAFMTVALAPAMPSVTTTATVSANNAAPTATASAASGASLSASVAASAVAPTVSAAAQSGVALSCNVSASTAAPTAAVAAQAGASLSAAVAASCVVPTVSATASNGASLSATVSASATAPTCSAAASIGGSLSASVAASAVAPTASAVCVSGAALSAAVAASSEAPSAAASAILGNSLSATVSAAVTAPTATAACLSGGTLATVSASAAAPTAIATCLSGVELSASVSAATIAPTAATVAVSGVSVSASVTASSVAPTAAASATIGGFISCAVATSTSAPTATASAVAGASLTCSVAASGSAPTCSVVATAEQTSPVATVSASNAAPVASVVASSGLSLEAAVSANANAPTAAASAISGFQLLVLAAASVAVATASVLGQSGAALSGSVAVSIEAPTSAVAAAVAVVCTADALSAAPTASATAYLGLSLSAECSASVSVPTCSAFAMIGEPFVPISGTRRASLRTWKASIPVRSNTRQVTQ